MAEKIDNLTKELIEVRSELSELKKSNELILDQMKLIGNSSIVPEAFITVSIS